MMKAKSAIFIAALAALMLSALVLCTGIGIAESPTEIQNTTASVPEYQEEIEELAASARDLKKLIKQMSTPAHKIPGDIGAKTHTQYHRCEGFAMAICDRVDKLEKLSVDSEKNKEKMRELVVETLNSQANPQWGKFSETTRDMGELVEQALEADPEDENALKMQSILDEITDAQDALIEANKELGAKIQKPIVWECSCMGGLNPHRLANGNTLINEALNDRVIEVSPDGEIVWEYTEVIYPTDSVRMENGSTLIADKGNKRVIMVTPDKEIVWEYSGNGQVLTAAYGVRALDNGNVLIADQGNMEDPKSIARIIEVTGDKEVVWEYSGPAMEFVCPSFGGRLENGNTLIADNAGILDGKPVYVREITSDKEIAWEYSEGLTCVYTLERLGNGNTLICAQCDGRVIEVTPDGEKVWTYGAIDEPGGVQRLDNGNTLIGVFGENRVIEVAST